MAGPGPRPNTAPPAPRTKGQGKNTSDQEVNVQVLLRCRPYTDEEAKQRQPQVVRCKDHHREVSVVQNLANKQLQRTYNFDKVFGPTADQELIYEQAVRGIVEEVLEGFNCCIFAYGQTGTGKTYTMQGNTDKGKTESKIPQDAGVIPRAVDHIFQALEAAGAEYSIKVTFLELYNEEITDLLSKDDITVPSERKRLQLMEDSKGQVTVRGLEEVTVTNSEEIFKVIEDGTARRKTAETMLNKQSSRSHSVFSITIHIKESTSDGEELIKCGKLNLVDLAGSENISRSGTRESRAREAGEINKSLLTLGRVITALVERGSHVPYRDSKLTRLLRDALGGRSKTCIIATISPSLHHLEETLSTLDYAHRAKNIRNKPEVNQKMTKSAHIKELVAEIERLKNELEAMREEKGVYLPHETYNAEMEEKQRLSTRCEEIEGEIAEYKKQYEEMLASFNDLETKLESESVSRQEAERKLGETREELQKTENALDDAKKDIEYKADVISKQAQAEEALATRTSQLSSSLQESVNAVQGLFTKIDKFGETHSANTELVSSLNTDVASKLSNMESAFLNAVDAHKAHHQRIAENVDKLLSELQETKRYQQEKCKAIEDDVAKAAKNASSRLERLGEEQNSRLADVQKRHEHGLSEVAEKVYSTESDCKGEIKGALKVNEKVESELEKLVEEQKRASEWLVQGAEMLATKASDSLEKLSQAASRLGGAVEEEHGRCHSAVSDLSESMQAVQEQGKKELMESISALVENYFAKASTSLSDGVGKTFQSLSGSRQRLQQDAARLEENASVSAVSLQVPLAGTKRQAETSVVNLQEESGNLRESMAQLKGHGEAAMSSMETGRQGIDSAVEGWRHAVGEQVEQAKGETEVGVKETATNVDETSQAASKHREEMEQALSGHLESFTANCGTIRETVEEAENKLDGLGQNQQKEIEGVKMEVDTTLAERYRKEVEATGGTPKRSTISVLQERIPNQEDIDSLRANIPDEREELIDSD